MSLKNNPFYILRLPCSASRREVMEASEEMGFILDSSVCIEAQNSLINLNKRLNAEINWFIDSDNDALEEIRSCVENDAPIPTDGLTALSRLNATVFNFEESETDDPYELGYAILDIDEQFSSLDSVEITESINANRLKGKLATVQERDVAMELSNKRAAIRQSIAEKLTDLDDEDYIELITMLAEKCIADREYDDGVILSDVIDQYEVRMQSELEECTEEIKDLIDKIKRLPNGGAFATNISFLIRHIKNWDIIAQPLQLKAKASGMPHKNSDELGHELRSLALYLNNEKGKTDEAYQLVDAMRDVFAEISELKGAFESDFKALDRLRRERKEQDAVTNELDSLKEVSENLKNHATSSCIESFIDRVKKLDVKIKALKLDAETKTRLREYLCLMARGTAIALHNNKHQTQYAFNIARAISTEFSDLPSLGTTLKGDVSTLNQQLLLTRNAPSYPTYPTYPNTNQTSRKSGNKSFWTGIVPAFVIAIAFALIVFFINSSNKSSHDSSSSSQSSSSYTESSSIYTVTFNRDGGSGGSSSVSVKKGNSMPSATAPSKDGYVFKGYYSSRDGIGTKYYNSNMVSVHSWDKSSDGTLFACWDRVEEVEFSQNVSDYDNAYLDVKSIEPCVGIYTSFGNSDSKGILSGVVCECKTASGSTAYVYMTVTQYNDYIDSGVSYFDLQSGYFDTVTFSTARRIHGIARNAESVCDGLSSTTGYFVLKFGDID